ncbi:MAG: ATP-grasp domain-containing protein [Methylobacter sp.]
MAPAVDYFIGRYKVTDVVYGSGFECHPESLFYLNSRLNVLGNNPDVFARLLDKRAFFSALQQLDIPYPEVTFSAPNDGDWLVKPMAGQGGFGIRRYRAEDDSSSGYWQRFLAGAAHSVLFLADGFQAHIVGFNTQWTVRLSDIDEFVFSGVINHADLPGSHKREICSWLQQIVPAFGLKGLNSLDFIHEGGRSYVLEINPRPSASMQLYDSDLLKRHIRVCAEEHLVKSDSMEQGVEAQGYQVVYAEHDVVIPEAFEWPEWCADLPKPSNTCHQGQPICSIISRQEHAKSVAEQLLTQQQFILNKLTRGFDRHGIHSQR